MKKILLYLSFPLMFLLGATGMDATFPEDEGMGVESLLQADASAEYILPVIPELPTDCEARLGAESLAHQLRTSGRNQRSLSLKHVFGAKSSAYRTAKRHLEDLFHSVNGVYTSLPFQSWSVASDHYVFGMRRILL